MAKQFVVRVELHGADAKDYDQLHHEMTVLGFERTIVVNGVRMKLPTGTYIGGFAVGPTAVVAKEKANQAAAAVTKNTSLGWAVVAVETEKAVQVDALEVDEELTDAG